MILYCPHCGYKLSQVMKNGIASCDNCVRVFDSSNRNRLLSAGWLVRRQNIWDENYLVYHHGFGLEEAIRIIDKVTLNGYDHQEWLDHLNNTNDLKLVDKID